MIGFHERPKSQFFFAAVKCFSDFFSAFWPGFFLPPFWGAGVGGFLTF